MATPIVGQPAETAQQVERELRIEIYRDDWARFEGTAAQLQAEGLIPEGFEWPRAAADKQWEANGFDYWLKRRRPEGHKGPMRSWLELDNWSLRVNVTGRDCHWHTRRRLQRQAQALSDACYRETAAGKREWNANWERYWRTQDDVAFRAFKAKVPALVPPRRARKTTTQPQA